MSTKLMNYLNIGDDQFEVADAAARAGIGSPLVAATAADMTDTSKIYVYTGSETGYTAGNWYYYNGSAWTSGGIYNSAAVNVDTTLTVAGAAADAKVVGDKFDEVEAELVNKANVDGAYENMTVGNAEQLISTVGETNKTPYLFRTSGGSIDIGDREVDKLVGGTVAFNQLVSMSNGSTTSNDVTYSRQDNIVTLSGTATADSFLLGVNMNIPEGHKVLVKGCPSGGSLSTYYLKEGYSANAYADTGNGNIVEVGATNAFQIYIKSGVDADGLVFKPQFFDLTQMFGSTIADYIYTLEQSQAGDGVAWFRNLFNAEYYAYNAGQLMSVKTSSHDMVGFNAYDNSTGKAKLIGGMEYQITGTYTSLSYSTGETITPDVNGKFTPSANGELTVTGGNATDTCVHLVWDGERDGEYEEYKKYSYALDSDLELRGLLKLDASNNLYYDGDTYESDGTVTRNYEYRAYASGDESLPDTITDGTHTVSKLITPTTESADPFTNPQAVDDFGTEEYVDSRTVPIPVGHDTMYQANLRAKLETAPNLPEANGLYLVKYENGDAAYQQYISPVPTLPTEDGTYSLKCTVADGTASLSWIADT